MLCDLATELGGLGNLARKAIGTVAIRALQQPAQHTTAFLHQLQHVAAEFLRIGDAVLSKVELGRHRLGRIGSFLLHRTLVRGVARPSLRLISAWIGQCQTWCLWPQESASFPPPSGARLGPASVVMSWPAQARVSGT